MSTENDSEELLKLTETVVKLGNSTKRYINIPDEHFPEIKHGDQTDKILKRETDDEIHLTYIFKKRGK